MYRSGLVINFRINHEKEALTSINDYFSIIENHIYFQDNKSMSFSRAIEFERKNLFNKNIKPVFVFKSTGLFEIINSKLSPFTFCKSIKMHYNELEYICRVKPIEMVCNYSADNVREFSERKYEELKNSNLKTFKLDISFINSNKKARKSEILDICCSIFQRKFTVNLDNPDIVILVYGIKNNLGMSITYDK